MPRSCPSIWESFSWPSPPRSWSIRSNPVATPSSVTAGGGKAKIMAPRIREKAPMARPATAWAFSSGFCRRSQSFSLTKTIPWFCPRPEKTIPEIAMQEATASFWSIR